MDVCVGFHNLQIELYAYAVVVRRLFYAVDLASQTYDRFRLRGHQSKKEIIFANTDANKVCIQRQRTAEHRKNTCGKQNDSTAMENQPCLAALISSEKD
ncbi:hypothetical protein RB195_001613 [Necator americanus]|uniref:Uncharacterized protein n=1 Tax=Necator americanus TaxID=51031 RepID=A0ABR1DF47_NECAM